MRGFLFGALLLGCSASGETGAPSDRNDGGTSASGGSEQAGGAGLGGEATGTSGGGSGGFAGAPDLCQAGDERLCSCAPTYGGKQTCSDFGWNLCVCPGWPPEGGAGGCSAGTGGSSAWPTCPRDPSDTSTSRYPNGCPVSWLPVGFSEPTCTAGTDAPPNSGGCTFDCRDIRPCDTPGCVPVKVLSESRRAKCTAVGGDCSEDGPMCLP